MNSYIYSLEGVTRWHYRAAIIKNTSMSTYVEAASVNFYFSKCDALILNSNILAVFHLDKLSLEATFRKWSRSIGSYL